MNRFKRSVFLLGVSVLAALFLPSAPAEASNPDCWANCEIAFQQCSIEAGCRSAYCRDGSNCRSGRCDDGTACTPAIPCDNIHCIHARSACIENCRDWWIPELLTVTTFEIPDLVRQDIVFQLDSLRLEIESRIEQLAADLQHRLGNYREQVETLRQNQQLDDKTATALIDMANEVQSTLSRRELLDHVMTEPTH